MEGDPVMNTRSNTRSPLDEVCSVAEAAKLIGYHPRTVQRWCDEGRIVAKRFGPARRSLWLVDLQSLKRFVVESGRIRR